MTTQPKTVAELREAILPHLLDLEALDELCRRAEANELLWLPDNLRTTIELNFDNCPSCGQGVDTGWECNVCGKDWKPLVDLALAAAPSQEPKAGRDDTLADLRKQLGLAADCETVAITEAVRGLRAKLEAASVTESSDRAKTWHENCELFLWCLERVADAADARLRCAWPDLHKFVAPRAKLEAAERDLAAARAKDETGWLIEAKKGGRPWWLGKSHGLVGHEVSDANDAIRFCRRQDAEKMIALWNSLADMPHLLSEATEHAWIATNALTAPAAEPEKPPRCGDSVIHSPSGEEWIVAYVEGDYLSPAGYPECLAKLSDCKIDIRCSDAIHRREVAMWRDSSGEGIRRGKVLELYGSVLAEPEKPDPVPDTARAEGDKVLRKWLESDHEVAAVLDELCRRALEGK